MIFLLINVFELFTYFDEKQQKDVLFVLCRHIYSLAQKPPLITILLYSFRNFPFPFFLIFSPHSSSSSLANTYSHILFISTFPYLLSSSPYPHLAYLFLFHLLPPQIPRRSTGDVINSLRFSSVCLKVVRLKQERRFV